MLALLLSFAVADIGPGPSHVEPPADAPPVAPAPDRAAIRAELAPFVAPAELDEAVEATVALMELEASFQRQQGDVTIADGLATLALGDQWSFIDGPSAARVIEAWGNPRPTEDPVGMIGAANLPFIDGGWAVIVTYTADGHVDDADAASIDFDAMLAEMQQDARDGNVEREQLGLDPIELVGWAEPPHYDATTKKLYWAKLLRAPGGESLNYNVRVLGRVGVLELTAVAAPESLGDVKPAMEALLAAVTFNEGHRYADFDPDVDAMAAYGIGALIAGKLATKAGLFKVLIAGLLASKKLVAGAAVALFAGARRLFGRKTDAA